jgi:predicted nucleic acid-binding Zn ribbon protein
MPTYIYESIPESCCDDPKHYEIDQSEHDAPLSHHPETGESIKRVLIGDTALVKQEEDKQGEEGDSCCGSSGCC